MLEARCVSEHLLQENLDSQQLLSHAYRGVIELVYRTRFAALKKESIKIPDFEEWLKHHENPEETQNASKIVELLVKKLDSEAKKKNDIEKNLTAEAVILKHFNVESETTHKCNKGHTWKDPRQFDLFIKCRIN